MEGQAIYYPKIHFKDVNWLKASLLYWDGIRRIVPPSVKVRDSDDVQCLVKEGLVVDVDPGSYRGAARENFLANLRKLYQSRDGKLPPDTLGGDDYWAPDPVDVQGKSKRVWIHAEKIDGRIALSLESLERAERDGPWWKVERRTAGLYMMSLAHSIGAAFGQAIVTDTDQRDAAGLFINTPSGSTQPSGGTYVLARLVTSFPAPADMERVTVKELVKFRAQNEKLRGRFRRAMHRAARDIANYQPDEWQARLRELKREIDDAEKEQRKRLDEIKVRALTGLLKISVPTWMAATFAPTPYKEVAIATGVGFHLVNWFGDWRGQRDAVSERDWHYLLPLRSRFPPPPDSFDANMAKLFPQK